MIHSLISKLCLSMQDFTILTIICRHQDKKDDLRIINLIEKLSYNAKQIADSILNDTHYNQDILQIKKYLKDNYAI